MKKLLTALLLIASCYLYNIANAVEIKIEGQGSALLTGYDIKTVRNKQDTKMSKKAKNSNLEVIQTQQIKEASRQAETRKKQDQRLSNTVRTAIVTEAQENALKAGIKLLIDRTLGINASKNPEILAKFNDILSQASTFIIDQNFTGEIKDNNYVAKVYLTIDETEFRTLLSDLGVALNTQAVRAHSIMIVLDEFFVRPSDLSKSIVTKDVTTYKYNYDKRIKEAEKDNSTNYINANAYKQAISAGAKSSYGHFVDYSKKENEFFQNIKEYDVLSPKAKNLNYTQSALQNSFTTYDIRALDNDVFKSKYFKGNTISSDKLANSAELAKYVEAARKDAKADFFAIGVSYITDNGKNENTGRNTCDGNVFVKIYSTVDGEVIASGTFTETAAGNSADQARAAVANKIGNELGEVLSKKVQDYWRKRMMYGSEYIVQIKGNFMPVERITMNKALQNIDGIKNVSMRSSDSLLTEYTINYSGSDSIGDAIFMKLYDSNMANKFKNYDYKITGNQIIFAPIKKYGVSNL